MSCEHCQEHLLDLVYGEADSKDEGALRVHVEGCASCQASFEELAMARRLAGEMPVEEPSLGATEAILAAARAHVGAAEAQLGTGDVVSAGDRDGDEGLWASIMRWAGSFAMGPQVAMATIMLLVVSTGLWYFPSRRHAPEATGSTVMSPDLEGEVGPSGTLTPAAPLDLAIDERTGRIRARGDAVPSSPRLAAGDQNAPSSAVGAASGGEGAGRFGARVIAARDPGSQAEALAADEADEAEPQARGRERLAVNDSFRAEQADADDLELARGYGATGGLRQQAAQAAPVTLDDADGNRQRPSRRSGQGLARPESTAPTEAPSPAPVAPESLAASQATNAGAAPSEPTPADAREAYARGMQRFQRGNYWGAAEDFNRVYRHPDGQEGLIPSALHHMAQSHRRASSCRTAVPHYASLLSRYPNYSGTPRAMIELADCYRSLGRLGDARTTLEGAQRHASVASEARRELLRVDQMQRARRRMGSEDVPAAAAAEAQ